jgi:hypothetical protein
LRFWALIRSMVSLDDAIRGAQPHPAVRRPKAIDPSSSRQMYGQISINIRFLRQHQGGRHSECLGELAGVLALASSETTKPARGARAGTDTMHARHFSNAASGRHPLTPSWHGNCQFTHMPCEIALNADIRASASRVTHEPCNSKLGPLQVTPFWN